MEEYLKQLAMMLYIYGTDAYDVYLEEFEEVKADPDTYKLMLRYHQEIVDAGL